MQEGIRVNSVAMCVIVWLSGHTICDQTSLTITIALTVADQLKVSDDVWMIISAEKKPLKHFVKSAEAIMTDIVFIEVSAMLMSYKMHHPQKSIPIAPRSG